MKKLLFIPRAIIDILSVWNKQISIKEKSSLTYTLSILKLKKWLNKKDAIITYPLFEYKLKGWNNEFLQMLVKEIFVDKVYDVADILKPSKEWRIIDAGANVGLAVLFFKRNFKNARIEAYEPGETSFRLLQENIAQNKIRNVQVEKKVVSDSDQPQYAEAGCAPGSVNQKFSTAGNHENPVSSVRMVDLLRQKGADCVKLDIEGDEVKVLLDVIESDCLSKAFCWLIEFHDEEHKDKFIKEFQSKGFAWRRTKSVYCFWQTKTGN